MVTAEDLRNSANKYFSSLFDPSKVTCAICCNTSKVNEIKQGFEGYVSTGYGRGLVCSISGQRLCDYFSDYHLIGQLLNHLVYNRIMISLSTL